MKLNHHIGRIIATLSLTSTLLAAQEYTFRPENPVTGEWLTQHIRKQSPRLMLTPDRLARLKSAVAEDDTAAAYYTLLKQDADTLCQRPVIEFKMTGKRMLMVSRESIHRVSCLAIVANIEADSSKYVDRLNAELLSICSFESWNPSHFLDVAEMALAVSIGIDWCYDLLPKETINIAKEALLHKALLPGTDPERKNWWVSGGNNWNQVCHGGLTAAAIVMADSEPDLSAKIISRALTHLPIALKTYHPAGVYPEGVSYWDYATYYSVFMIEMCSSALGTDFDLINAPGFKESALFARMMVAPSGNTYNFFDCGKSVAPLNYWPLLAWFDSRNGQRGYYSRSEFAEYLDQAITNKKRTAWFNPIPLIWISETNAGDKPTRLPERWMGEGPNPIMVYRNDNDTRGFYFGAKGGKASLSHGNMDAGSFVYELDGIRWAVDLGMQGYTALEEIMGSQLWNSRQNSRRWELISKNNFGHNTLSVNGQLHDANAFSPLTSNQDGSFSIDLTPQFFGHVDSAMRTIKKRGTYGVEIHDCVIPNKLTKATTWSMLTTGDATVKGSIILLKQNGRSLRLHVKRPTDPSIKIIPLDPPPLPHDMEIKGLKRIEIIQTAETANSPIEYAVELNRL